MPEYKLPSIRTRLSFWMLSISLFFAALTAGAVWFVLEHEMDEMMNQELREAGELIYHLTSGRSIELLSNSHPERGSAYEEHLIWQVVDLNTQTVLARSHKAPTDPLLDTAHETVKRTASQEWHATTFRMPGGANWHLIVAQSDEERTEAKDEAVLYALMSSVISALLVSALLNWRIRQELRPLNRLSDQVRDLDLLGMTSRLESAQRQELKPIEDALDELGHRLKKRVASEQAFIAHAAHALRTPLAGVDAQLAVAIRQAKDPVLPRLKQARESTRRLRHVMQALLSLFRSGMDIHCRMSELTEFIQSLGYAELKLVIVKNTDQDLIMVVDTDLLSAVLFNLFDNSKQHGASKIQISLQRSAESYHLRLQDDGSGCTKERVAELNQVLQDQKYAAQESASGLGLILADLVMRSHRGGVRLIHNPEGFTVDLFWSANLKVTAPHQRETKNT